MPRVECARCKFMFWAQNSRAKYCSSGCRNAAWKERNDYRDHRAPAGPRSGANARSGLQVSYRRAVKQVEQLLRLSSFGYAPGEAKETAEATIRAALSERQRRELDAR